MNRILKRPMFRKGGMPNEGIMSGLIEPRQNFFSGGITPGSILTPGGGVMTPNVSSPIGVRSIFYPPVTTTAAGVPATISPTIPPPISPSSPRSVPFMERAGQLTRSGLGTLLRLGTLPAAFSGPALLAYSNKPKTLEELLIMKEQGALDETMTEDALRDYYKRISDARKDGTPIGKDDTGLFSTIEEIKKTLKPEGSSYDEAGIKPKPKPEPKVGPEKTPKSDTDTIKDYIDMFKTALAEDPDEIRRQKYLQLAQFGANLLAQPGGNLTAAVGKAAEPSLAGLAKIQERKQDVATKAKLLGVEAALKKMDPTQLQETVEYLMSTGLTKEEALNAAITGSATKGATAQGARSNFASVISETYGIPSAIASKISGKVFASGISDYLYDIIPENPTQQDVGKYFYDKKGNIGKLVVKDGKFGLEDGNK